MSENTKVEISKKQQGVGKCTINEESKKEIDRNFLKIPMYIPSQNSKKYEEQKQKQEQCFPKNIRQSKNSILVDVITNNPLAGALSFTGDFNNTPVRDFFPKRGKVGSLVDYSAKTGNKLISKGIGQKAYKYLAQGGKGLDKTSSIPIAKIIGKGLGGLMSIVGMVSSGQDLFQSITGTGKSSNDSSAQRIGDSVANGAGLASSTLSTAALFTTLTSSGGTAFGGLATGAAAGAAAAITGAAAGGYALGTVIDDNVDTGLLNAFMNDWLDLGTSPKLRKYANKNKMISVHQQNKSNLKVSKETDFEHNKMPWRDSTLNLHDKVNHRGSLKKEFSDSTINLKSPKLGKARDKTNTTIGYIVMKGDKIHNISKKFNISIELLRKVNKNKLKKWPAFNGSGKMIEGFNVGEIIWIPR